MIEREKATLRLPWVEAGWQRPGVIAVRRIYRKGRYEETKSYAVSETEVIT